MSGERVTRDGGETPDAHDPRHEELLTAVLTGDIAPGAGEAVEIDRCPVCAVRLRRMREVTGMLDAAGVEHRQILDEVLAPQAQPRSRPPRRTRWPLLAAAAAVLAICATIVPFRGCAGERRVDDRLLGPEAAEGFAPSGIVPAGEPWGPFSWPDPGVLDPRYVVEVFGVDAAGTRSADPIARSEPLSGPRWLPTTEQQARLLRWDRIAWSVVVRDHTTGKPARMREVRAWRE